MPTSALLAAVLAAVVPDLPPHAAAGEAFVVAAPHRLASEAGVEVLARGGNVVDAAVAAALATGVVRPHSSGIGGGGFMIIHLADRGSFALDFREVAPAGARPEAFLDAQGEPIAGRSSIGAWSVAVPCSLRGLEAALRRFGTISLAEAVAPAVRIARDGFAVDPPLARSIEIAAEAIARERARRGTSGPDEFSELERIYLPGGRPPSVGELLRQPDLAATLELVGREGAESFYRGPLAEAIVRAVRSAGGPLSGEDLAAVAPAWRTPLRATLAGRLAREGRPLEVVTMPPPSSGGACLLQVLLALDGMPAVPEPERTRRLVELLRHAFADRAAFLGDPDASPEVTADVARMLDPAHLARLRESVAATIRAAPDRCGLAGLGSLDGSAPGSVVEDGGTAHLSVLDSRGNAVALTETINLDFGSKVIPPGTGIILNDEIDDFSLRAGVPNAFGLVMSSRNLLAPGRRPLSSMSPTIVLDGDRATIAVGASGGPRIISATLQVLRLLLEGASAAEAVEMPRLHHQWMPDRVLVERDFAPALREMLTLAGHEVREGRPAPSGDDAIVQAAVAREDGRLEAASDPREWAAAAGR